jgi:hypothetical protein
MTTVERVAEAIRRNPEGLLLLGAGVALMFRNAATGNAKPQRKRRSKPASDNYYDSATGATSDGPESAGLAGKVGAAAGDVRKYVAETADDVRNYVAESAQDLTEKASEYREAAARRAKQAADGAYRSAEGVFESHPMSIAMAGLAAGCLAAAVFPSTRFERDTLGPIGRRAADAVSDTGARVKSAAAQRVSEAAARAGEQLADAAVQGTLSAATLGTVVREAAADLTAGVAGDAGKSDTAGRQPTARMAKAQL